MKYLIHTDDGMYLVGTDEHLAHFGFKSKKGKPSALLGTFKKNHKYILRVETGKKFPRYEYFYTQAEVDAYNARKKKEQEEKDQSQSSVKDTESGFVLILPRSWVDAAARTVSDAARSAFEHVFGSKKKDTEEEPKPEPKPEPRPEDESPEPTKTKKPPVYKTVPPDGTNLACVRRENNTMYIDKPKSVDINAVPEKNDYVDSQLPKKTKPTTRDSDQEATNSGIPEEARDAYTRLTNPDYTYTDYDLMVNDYDLYNQYNDYYINCLWCTETYNLRRRGYDVTARPNNTSDYEGTMKEMYDHYENPVIVTNKSYTQNSSGKRQAVKDIEATLRQYPEGSYGPFDVDWEAGGGHSMVWSIENGEVVIRDCQVNKKHTVSDIMDRSMVSYAGSFWFCRTDNLVLKDNILEVVRER